MTTPPSKGVLPRTAPRQFLMPTLRQSVQQPALPVEPTLEGAPQPRMTGLPIGDPAGLSGPPSDGTGGRGGIGTGGTGGVGNRSGPGFGDGEGGITGQSQTLLTTQPVLVYKVEPEFSEDARKARVQGVVVLVVTIDEQGRVGRVQVRASLGLGLDEKAIEAVKKWRFRPATRNGRAVSAPAIIEVSFHLL